MQCTDLAPPVGDPLGRARRPRLWRGLRAGHCLAAGRVLRHQPFLVQAEHRRKRHQRATEHQQTGVGARLSRLLARRAPMPAFESDRYEAKCAP